MGNASGSSTTESPLCFIKKFICGSFARSGGGEVLGVYAEQLAGDPATDDEVLTQQLRGSLQQSSTERFTDPDVQILPALQLFCSLRHDVGACHLGSDKCRGPSYAPGGPTHQGAKPRGYTGAYQLWNLLCNCTRDLGEPLPYSRQYAFTFGNVLQTAQRWTLIPVTRIDVFLAGDRFTRRFFGIAKHRLPCSKERREGLLRPTPKLTADSAFYRGRAGYVYASAPRIVRSFS